MVNDFILIDVGVDVVVKWYWQCVAMLGWYPDQSLIRQGAERAEKECVWLTLQWLVALE
jgi:hypothetical protein